MNTTRTLPGGNNAAVADPSARNSQSLFARLTSRSDLLRRFGLWLVLAVVFIGFCIASPTFRDPVNFQNILQQNAIIGIVACGMTIMMISGGFDLSVGATGATAGMVAAFISNAGLGDVATVLSALAIGTLIGFINGFIIAKVKINAFVTTFAMASVVSGLLFVVTEARPLTGGTEPLRWAARGMLGPIPVVFVIFVLCLVIVWFILTRTKFGHYVYSIGGNAEASHLSGVPVDRVQILAFALGGLFAAAGGLLLFESSYTAQASAAGSWPLASIAICVVGGVALTGGVGRIEDVLAATLLLGVIGTGLRQIGVDSYWEPAVTGTVILLAVALDQYSRRKQRSASRTTPQVSDSTAPGSTGGTGSGQAAPVTGSPA